MPNIVYPNEAVIDYAELASKDYQYEYPNNLDLKPGSDLHTFVKNQILQRARISYNMMNRRFDGWNEIDEKMTAYIPTTEKEKEIRDDDRRKPVSIVFPYSYAIMETILSYMVAAFFPDPIFRYEGVSPEDEIGAIMMEKTVELHCNRSKVALNLHTMFRDAIAYGVGVVAPIWSKKSGYKVVERETGFFDFLSTFTQTGREKAMEETVLFEGNALQNIDPYRYLPDPNVPIHDVQKGEFVGWLDETNLMNLLDDETQDDSLFNVRYLHHVGNKRSSLYSTDQSKRMEKIGGSFKDATVNRPLDVIYMYMKLIPKQWKIGDSEYPEKWLFALASDSIVIKAKPLGLCHNDFPITVTAPDFDGYSPTAVSRLEMLFGMQETLDWLFNSHLANVRKVMNDMIIVDPYLVNINDMKDPQPGKLIRLRRPAWGRGVENVAKQLDVSDITKANIGDSAFIMQFMQQIGGTDNPTMGTLRSGGPERLSAREFQGTMAGAVSRLERIAKVIGLQAMQDIGYMFASHTQQLMSRELYTTTTGRWEETLRSEYNIVDKRMKVTPFDLLIDYDVLIRDGSIPGGNFADVWVQMFQVLASQPELLKVFDIVRVFNHIARNLGAKNVEEFKRKTPIQSQTMSDEEVGKEVDRGNLMPVEGL